MYAWDVTTHATGDKHPMRKCVIDTTTVFLVRAHFSKRGILKVCKAFFSRICHAAVFTQLGYADPKSAPCQALF